VDAADQEPFAFMTLFSKLDALAVALLREEAKIPAARKAQLGKLADYIAQQSGRARLNFICSHNSRRSHISQIWAAVGSAYFDLSGLETYSGGTEATAFNPRAVAALQRVGFQIDNPAGENPRYQVRFTALQPPLTCYSKTFDDPPNPKSDFAAIMTCSDADENCPLIPGAEFRLPLTYEDPKAADGTPEEAARYDEHVRQIGREILYAMYLAAQKLKQA
jgi:arsenate reductase